MTSLLPTCCRLRSCCSVTVMLTRENISISFTVVIPVTVWNAQKRPIKITLRATVAMTMPTWLIKWLQGLDWLMFFWTSDRWRHICSFVMFVMFWKHIHGRTIQRNKSWIRYSFVSLSTIGWINLASEKPLEQTSLWKSSVMSTWDSFRDCHCSDFNLNEKFR